MPATSGVLETATACGYLVYPEVTKYKVEHILSSESLERPGILAVNSQCEEGALVHG